MAWGAVQALLPQAAKVAGRAWDETSDSGVPSTHPPGLLPDDTPVAAAKNMPGDSADLFGDGSAEDGGAANGRLWRTVIIGEQEHRIDLHMIRPYMRVVTHGGETTPRGPPPGCSWATGAPRSVALSEPQALHKPWDVKHESLGG